MKQFRTLLIALSFVFGAVALSNAQDSKVAHINTQELIETMPAYKSAMSQLEKLESTYRADIDDLYKEAQSKNQRYQQEAVNQTEEENAKRAQELQQDQQKIVQFQQNAQKELQKKESELLRPVYEKARTSIQKVAREKGYDYVLDSTTGAGGVILADGYDLMADVKKDLGI
ncbi:MULTISPECIES: OmpH family outer membrane protein [Mesonia]|uniref:Membrane protein n=1 Tax=Mesonia mobilis TaxID=369791 RepID=A0ABQ3BHQ7_9FLAO|nr:OmpH family outer membrane protein [Mesonia mobilis]MBQ0737777.1 OmpH family outer membrane protein [Aquimarina celericrescens]GGZ45111.1 membrane protein [Mesonia mobilis]|tara:strand:- start:2733 stop:3248 length:516 start_codon:yes stop_codon:yes gene_type:complete